MNEKIMHLHTLARNYCINKKEKYINSINTYRKSINLQSETIDMNLKLNFLENEASMNIINICLIQLESIDIDEFDDFDTFKDHILYLCSTLFDEINIQKYLASYKENNEKFYKFIYTCMLKEQEKFRLFIDNTSNLEIKNVQPIFYRKILSKNEINTYLNKIKSLEDKDLENICVKKEQLQKIININDFREILSKSNIDKLFEISHTPEDALCSEIDVSIFNPLKYSNDMGTWYWCTKDMNFLICSLDTGYIDIKGNNLVEKIRNLNINKY